ncbi:MAG: class I adenylate-forming enzyme family protein [Acidimicrobiales bacterium]
MRTPVFPEHLPTLPGLLRWAAGRWGGRDCVATPDGRLTYDELEAQSRVLAGRLVRAGAGKGTRVGVLFPNGMAWVVAWAAAARIGAVVIPVNTFYRPTELARFLVHADVEYILGVASFIQHDYIERLEMVAPELARCGSGPLYLPSLPHLRRVLLWGTSPRPWAEGGYGDLSDRPDGLDDAMVCGLEAQVTPSDPMLVTYTSGSTGEPKGVVHGHGPLVRHARNLAALSGADDSSRIWTPMPLCWVGGFAFTLLRALTVGGCFVTQEVFDPGTALALLERERVTIVSAWPAASKALREHPSFATTDLSSVVAGSFYEALPAGRRPPDPGLIIGSLGMSETGGPHTFWTAEEEVWGAPEAYRGAFGHEVPGVEHRIVDPDSSADLAPGEEGEVLVRGYSLMLGLHKKERAEVFDADGWYHTGDRGYFRDGWFFFTGRQSDLIKTAGSNVAPAEVETCLLAEPEVKLAFVVGVPDVDRGENVVALVVPWAADATDGLGAVLRNRLKDRLSSYKVPARVEIISEADVPWLVSQKADRRALAALAARLTEASTAEGER